MDEPILTQVGIGRGLDAGIKVQRLQSAVLSSKCGDCLGFTAAGGQAVKTQQPGLSCRAIYISRMRCFVLIRGRCNANWGSANARIVVTEYRVGQDCNLLWRSGASLRLLA